jgi:hypothetical protein
MQIGRFVDAALQHTYHDRAVFYTLLSRIFSIGVGPLVIFSVGAFLSPSEQGVYYVFGSLLQLRALIDLGFSQSSQQLLANKFSSLIFTPAQGLGGPIDLQRQFLNLAKFTCRAYALIGVLTILCVGVAGDIFLSSQLEPHSTIIWRGSWWTIISSVGLGISSLGIVVVADGANQVALTNRWRFWSELVAILAFIGVLMFGGGLWASAAMAFARLGLAAPVVFELGRRLIRQINTADASAVSFKKTIWPLQSRNMIVWGFSFICYYAYSPLTLKFLGPESAGVVGMSLQISNMTSSIALIWYNTKLPRLGSLAGSADYIGMKKLNQTGSYVSMVLWTAIAASAVVLLRILDAYFSLFASRFAPTVPMLFFLMGAGAFVWSHVRASYMRAFCVEMFVWLAITQGIGTIVLLTLLLPKWGEFGASFSYFMAMIVGAAWTENRFRHFSKTS